MDAGGRLGHDRLQRGNDVSPVAIFNGKVQVSSGKICHSCCSGSEPCSPPSCLHIAIYDDSMVLVAEADLLLVPGDSRGNLVWAIADTSAYPYQLHFITWNRELGTYGDWQIHVDYWPSGASHIQYGSGAGEGSYCDGLSGTFVGGYDQTIVVSPCAELLALATPLQSPRKTGCNSCRGLA